MRVGELADLRDQEHIGGAVGRGRVVDALRAYPTVNSSIDIEARTMTMHRYVNLGIAVDWTSRAWSYR